MSGCFDPFSRRIRQVVPGSGFSPHPHIERDSTAEPVAPYRVAGSAGSGWT